MFFREHRAGGYFCRRLAAPLTAAALALASWTITAAAHADPPGPDALPITVVALQTPDADDQAEALTAALRNAVRIMPGYSLGEGDYSLEVLALSMKCSDPPDAACESRIADQIKSDRYIWGIINKKAGTVTGEVHLWVRGKGTTKVGVNYSANLTEPNDDALKKVAGDAVLTLTGGSPKGNVHIRAGDVPGQVFVDGQPIGALVAGEGTFPLAAGSHRVVVKTPGYGDVEASVMVRPNATVDVTLNPVAQEPDSPTNWRLIGGLAGIGAGIGFGVVGLVSALKVNSTNNDESFTAYRKKVQDSSIDVCDHASAKPPADTEAQNIVSLCDDAKTFEVMQVVFFSLAAVSGGVGIYLLATSSSAPEASASGITFSPRVGRTGGKLDVAYRF